MTGGWSVCCMREEGGIAIEASREDGFSRWRREVHAVRSVARSTWDARSRDRARWVEPRQVFGALREPSRALG